MSAEIKPYVVTATDARGRRDTFAREAASLEHLRNVLEREGYVDIEFVDDELTAALRQQRPEEGRPTSAATYRLEAKLQRGDAPAAIWLAAARNSALTLLLAVAAIGWGIWGGGGPWWIVAGVLVIVGWFLLVRSGRRRSGDYNELLQSFARGDFEAGARLVEAMRKDPANADNDQLQADLAFRAAVLQAKAGDVDGALASVEHLRRSPHGANGLFESRVGGLHYMVGDMPAFVAAMEEGFVQAGRGQMQQLDLALTHARVGDVARARELLAGVDRRNLSAMHKPIAVAVEGMIARREGDEEGAALLLTDAVAGFSAYSANPAVWPIHGVLVGHQALALAQSGDRHEAIAALEGWEEVVQTCLDPGNRAALDEALKS